MPICRYKYPQINYSPCLTSKKGKITLEMAGNTELESFGTSPVLSHIPFEIDPNGPEQIYWLNDNAKEMISH